MMAIGAAIFCETRRANVLFSYKLGREQMATSDGWIAVQPTGDYFGPELSFARRVSQKMEALIARSYLEHP